MKKNERNLNIASFYAVLLDKSKFLYPNSKSDVLIYLVSSNCRLDISDFVKRSEPARSHLKYRLINVASSVKYKYNVHYIV